MILRLTDDRFNTKPTIGCDFPTKKMFVNNEPVILQIWDTAGQERFGTLSKAYYRGAHGIFFTFDITSEQSFQEVQKTYQKTTEEFKNMSQSTSCVLIGCKNDLEQQRMISYDVAMAYAESQGMHYIETSAKMGRNCLEAADHLAKLCFEQIKNQKVEEKPKLVRPQFEMQKKTTLIFKQFLYYFYNQIVNMFMNKEWHAQRISYIEKIKIIFLFIGHLSLIFFNFNQKGWLRVDKVISERIR